MPVDRLKTFLHRLSQAGLIRILEEEGTLYMLMPRGTEFLDAYWTMKGFLSAIEEE